MTPHTHSVTPEKEVNVSHGFLSEEIESGRDVCGTLSVSFLFKREPTPEEEQRLIAEFAAKRGGLVYIEAAWCDNEVRALLAGVTDDKQVLIGPEMTRLPRSVMSNLAVGCDLIIRWQEDEEAWLKEIPFIPVEEMMEIKAAFFM